MKVIRNLTTLVVVFDDGSLVQTSDCTNEMFSQVCKSTTKEEVIGIIMPVKAEVVKEIKENKATLNAVEGSQLLVQRGDSVYWEGVSELSMPKDLINKVLEAEASEDIDALEAYHNFWTLLSLNPDPQCRKNLFWFLSKWGITISKTGLFIGYRNVDIYREGTGNSYSQELCDFVKSSWERVKSWKKSPKNYFVDINACEYKLLKAAQIDDLEVMTLDDLYQEFKAVNFIVKNTGDDTVYTDHHSHSFRIQIGRMVTMPREKCDCDSNVSCSRGLHLGGMHWLRQSYFGDQGLVCLCNPADVVAVPHLDDYGKLRCCAYMPIALIEYDELGHVIPYNVKDGFESKYIKKVLYDGIKSTEESPEYTISIPNIPEISKESITQNILEIARTYIK